MTERDKNTKERSMPLWLTVLLWIITPLVILSLFGFSLGSFRNLNEVYEKRKVKMIMSGEETNLFSGGFNPFAGDEKAIEAGRNHFRVICSKCHGQDATGDIGPSLVDTVWLHGSEESDIYSVIMYGVGRQKSKSNPPRGPMPAYSHILGEKKVLEVMAWLNEFQKGH